VGSIKYLNRVLSIAYYNAGTHFGKSSNPQAARQSFKKATLFDPEPPLAVQIHHNWAVSINQTTDDLDSHGPDKTYERLAQFCEMISHFDEVIRQHALIKDENFKHALQGLETDAKRAVRGAIEMKSARIQYSDRHGGQLVMLPSAEGGEPILLKATWTEYNFVNEELRK
jgi:hypothetical protein